MSRDENQTIVDDILEIINRKLKLFLLLLLRRRKQQQTGERVFE